MKKVVIIAISFLLFVGCSSPDNSLLSDSIRGGQKGMIDVILTATLENSPVADTKTVLNAEGKVEWTPADEIVVFSDGQSSKFTSINTENSRKVNFRGTISFVTGATEGSDPEAFVYGLYPYDADATIASGVISTTIPSAQTGLAGSFADDLALAVAKSVSMNLSFKNAYSGIDFEFSEAGYTKVTLSSNNGELIAGPVTIAFNSDGIPVTTVSDAGSSSVTLTAPGNGTFETGKRYYILCAPQTLSNGYTLTAEKPTGKAVFEKTGSQVFRRNIFKDVTGNLNERATFVPFIEAVDLGLSVKWASCNLGASSPVEYGDYYAWGETDSKSVYSFDNYQWCNGSSNTLTKYNDNSDYGSIDNKTILEESDDVALVKLGSGWRMPTSAECTELLNTKANTADYTWTWCDGSTVQYNGTTAAGWKIVRNATSATLFLPAGGIKSNTDHNNAGTGGYYWSSSLSTGYSTGARSLCFGSNDISNSGESRNYGFSVRPVYGDYIHVADISLNKTSTRIAVGNTETLTATISPDNAMEKGITWTSDKTSVATVDPNGVITGIAVGTATITVTTADGSKTATCTVTVPAPDLVDLGLSVKWASFNVGALSPEEYGNHYAWGETEPYYNSPLSFPFWTWKDGKTGYNWASYGWCNGSSTTLTKYNCNSNYGPVDNKLMLEEMDDVAHVKFGSKWRIPTDDEWTELRSTKDNTTDYSWTWCDGSTVKYNGTSVKGWKIVRNATSATLFLPAAGYGSGSGFVGIGNSGNYWSSSLYYPDGLNQEPYAKCRHFETNYFSFSSYQSRCRGLSVRPVYGDFIPVSSVSLNKTTTSIPLGGTETLSVTISPSNATNKFVTWTSDATSIATVNSSGKITAVAIGEANITVKTVDGNKTATCKVTVSPVAVTGISLDEDNLSFSSLDATQQLTATITPSNATDQTVTWQSSDDNVATVSNTGLVTAKGSGSAIITATAGDQSATCAVTVTIPVTGVSLNKTSTSITIGGTETLTATVAPSDATNKAVSWSSSNTSVATVDNNGKITTKAVGSTTITVTTTDGSKTATCDVTVTAIAVTGVTLNKTTLSLTKGSYETLTATVAPSNATNQTVSWSSSSTSVATVDANGKVTAVAGGSATITATAGGKSATCAVTVTVPVTSISFSQNPIEFHKDEEIDILNYVVCTPSDATNVSHVKANLLWETTSNDIYVSNSYGKYYLVGDRFTQATITAKYASNSSIQASFVAKVIPYSVNSISISPAELNLTKNQTANVSISWNPTNSQDGNSVSWTSSNSNVATASGTTVTAKGSGTAILTATSGGKTATCSVNVSVPATSVSLNQSSLTFTSAGQSSQLSATVYPSDATDNVSWSSSNTNVATVSSTGLVTAVSAGTATITATTANSGKTATCSVTVKSFPTGNTFDEDAYITYVSNHQKYLNISTDKTYTYDTQFDAGGVSGTRVEMKFQIPNYTSGEKAILCYGGSNKSGLAIDASNIFYYITETESDDGDRWYEKNYTKGASGVNGTGVVVLTASFGGNQIAISVNGAETTIPVSVSSLVANYLFSHYEQQWGGGEYEYDYLAGVPNGAKLYYVKIWNGNNLVYFGHASRAICSYSSEEEYCWYDEVGDKYTFARNLHTLTGSESPSYGSNSVTVRQAFGGGIDL